MAYLAIISVMKMQSFILIILILGLQISQAQQRCLKLFHSKVVFSHIVATSSNFVIGDQNNKMPWGHVLKQDLKRFRDLTSNHIVIMGRKTYQTMYESLGGKPLPNRHSIVITRDPHQIPKHTDVTAVTTIEEAISVSEKMTSKYPNEVFVVGGGEIFTKTYDLVDHLYLTYIEKDIEGVIHYPNIDFSKYDIISNQQVEEAGFTYRFMNLKVKN